MLSFLSCCGTAADAAAATTADSSPPTTLKNSAFVFVKPHANTEAVRELVKKKLQDVGIEILTETSIDAKTMDKKKLIDQHYYAIASKATLLNPKDLPVPETKFQESFGESWQEDVLKEGRAANALQACERWSLSPEELNDLWQSQSDKVVKLGGGFYCGLLQSPKEDDKSSLYVFNAFFLTMRQKFVQEGASIYCYEVQWDPSLRLSWSKFRNQVLGPTDPAAAPRGSLRQTILAQWKELGLSEAPTKGDNGVHASASPLEGLAEKANWLGRDMRSDEAFGKHLIKQGGIPLNVLKEWSKDPQVLLDADGSKRDSIFDTLEDLDAKECYERMVELYGYNDKRKKKKMDEL